MYNLTKKVSNFVSKNTGNKNLFLNKHSLYIQSIHTRKEFGSITLYLADPNQFDMNPSENSINFYMLKHEICHVKACDNRISES